MEMTWAGVDGWVGSSLDGSVRRFKFGEIKPDELSHPQLPQIRNLDCILNPHHVGLSARESCARFANHPVSGDNVGGGERKEFSGRIVTCDCGRVIE